MGIYVDWSCRDSALYMQLLRDLRQPPVACAQAYHIPLILFFVNFQPSLSVSNRQSSPYSFASNSRTDRYGRYSQFHNGKEICNDFNSPNGCNATHKNFSRISQFAGLVRHLRTQHSMCKEQTIRVKPQPAIQSKQWLKVCRGYKYYYMFCTKWTFVIWISNVCFNTIYVDRLEQDLSCHQERSFVRQLITGLREGFDARIQQLSVQSYISGKKKKKFHSLAPHAEKLPTTVPPIRQLYIN